VKVVSLFSGAGGFDLGFAQAGHEIVWANDMYHDAVETYKLNLGNHIQCKKIETVEGNDVPDCDIIIGGFPCQGFSIANTKRHTDDERNKLYLELVRIIKCKRPMFFLAENVKGITTLANGKIIEMIHQDFANLGYIVKREILNAADFGVPQQRQRIFIAGVRDDIDFDFEFPAKTHNSKGTDGLQKWVGSGEALATLPDPDKPHKIHNHSYSKYKLRFNKYLGHRTIDPLKPAPTVTARGDDKGGVVVLHHPNNLRRMSCRELAIIQGFPIDYEFFGSQSSVYRQIGNAVPPPLALAIAKQFNAYYE
jgi:DNA (cytosine-5)-methyltransferase 1